jgi:hypothetical protein
MQEETSINLVRMVTGEDVLAEVVYVETDYESYYVLHNPMKVVYLSGARPGTLSISLMQWVFGRICDKQEFSISPKDVIFVNPASKSMEEYYWGTVDYFIKMQEQLESSVELDRSAKENIQDSLMEDDPNQNEMINTLMEMLKGSTKRTIH